MLPVEKETGSKRRKSRPTLCLLLIMLKGTRRPSIYGTGNRRVRQRKAQAQIELTYKKNKSIPGATFLNGSNAEEIEKKMHAPGMPLVIPFSTFWIFALVLPDQSFVFGSNSTVRAAISRVSTSKAGFVFCPTKPADKHFCFFR